MTIWIVGEFDRPLTRRIANWLSREEPTASLRAMRARPRAPWVVAVEAEGHTAVSNRLDDGSVPTHEFPDLIVVCQEWSDQYSAEFVDGLITSQPLATLVCVHGAWCAADGRSRDMWPLSVRVPFWRAAARLRAVLAAHAKGDVAALPYTASRHEIFAADYAPTVDSRRHTHNTEATKPTAEIAVVSREPAWRRMMVHGLERYVAGPVREVASISELLGSAAVSRPVAIHALGHPRSDSGQQPDNEPKDDDTIAEARWFERVGVPHRSLAEFVQQSIAQRLPPGETHSLLIWDGDPWDTASLADWHRHRAVSPSCAVAVCLGFPEQLAPFPPEMTVFAKLAPF